MCCSERINRTYVAAVSVKPMPTNHVAPPNAPEQYTALLCPLQLPRIRKSFFSNQNGPTPAPTLSHAPTPPAPTTSPPQSAAANQRSLPHPPYRLHCQIRSRSHHPGAHIWVHVYTCAYMIILSVSKCGLLFPCPPQVIDAPKGVPVCAAAKFVHPMPTVECKF